MNSTESIQRFLSCVDKGQIVKAGVYFCNDLNHNERDFILRLFRELRTKVRMGVFVEA